MVPYLTPNFTYFVVVPDIDKKHDVKCNTKKQPISRKISNNSSNGGLRRESLPRNEIPASEKTSLDHEHVDRTHCDSTKQSGKLNVLEKNVNAEENIDDGSKSLASGCTSDKINEQEGRELPSPTSQGLESKTSLNEFTNIIHFNKNEINNDDEIWDKEKSSQCSFERGFQRKQDETTTVETEDTEHLDNVSGNGEKDISHHQSSREKDTEQEINMKTNKETTTFEDARSSVNVVSSDIPNVQEKSKNGLPDYNSSSSRKPPEWKEMSPQSNELDANWNYNSMYDQPWGMFSGDFRYGYNWNMEFIKNDFESLKTNENISPLPSKATTSNLPTVEQSQLMEIPKVSGLPALGMIKDDESLQDSGQHKVGDKILKTEGQREGAPVSDRQSPNESTPDLENKIIKMEETASLSARRKKKLSKHTCAGKILMFLSALFCSVRSMI